MVSIEAHSSLFEASLTIITATRSALCNISRNIPLHHFLAFRYFPATNESEKASSYTTDTFPR